MDLRVHPLTTIISPIRRFVVYISLSPICQRTYETFVSRFQRYYFFFIFQKKLHLFFVPRVGFEPTTHRLEICCSIQLSYRGIYVFLIKYNKKIKNCFFQRTLVFLTISKILFFFEISNFFSTFSSVIVNITKPNQFFNELLRFFVFLTFAKILFFFETSNFFLNFFYFFPVTYCFYGTSVYVTFVTFRTNTNTRTRTVIRALGELRSIQLNYAGIGVIFSPKQSYRTHRRLKCTEQQPSRVSFHYRHSHNPKEDSLQTQDSAN